MQWLDLQYKHSKPINNKSLQWLWTYYALLGHEMRNIYHNYVLFRSTVIASHPLLHRVPDLYAIRHLCFCTISTIQCRCLIKCVLGSQNRIEKRLGFVTSASVIVYRVRGGSPYMCRWKNVTTTPQFSVATAKQLTTCESNSCEYWSHALRTRQTVKDNYWDTTYNVITVNTLLSFKLSLWTYF